MSIYSVSHPDKLGLPIVILSTLKLNSRMEHNRNYLFNQHNFPSADVVQFVGQEKNLESMHIIGIFLPKKQYAIYYYGILFFLWGSFEIFILPIHLVIRFMLWGCSCYI